LPKTHCEQQLLLASAHSLSAEDQLSLFRYFFSYSSCQFFLLTSDDGLIFLVIFRTFHNARVRRLEITFPEKSFTPNKLIII